MDVPISLLRKILPWGIIFFSHEFSAYFGSWISFHRLHILLIRYKSILACELRSLYWLLHAIQWLKNLYICSITRNNTPLQQWIVSPVNIGLAGVFIVSMAFLINNFFERAMVSYIMINRVSFLNNNSFRNSYSYFPILNKSTYSLGTVKIGLLGLYLYPLWWQIQRL